MKYVFIYVGMYLGYFLTAVIRDNKQRLRFSFSERSSWK